VTKRAHSAPVKNLTARPKIRAQQILQTVCALLGTLAPHVQHVNRANLRTLKEMGNVRIVLPGHTNLTLVASILIALLVVSYQARMLEVQRAHATLVIQKLMIPAWLVKLAFSKTRKGTIPVKNVLTKNPTPQPFRTAKHHKTIVFALTDTLALFANHVHRDDTRTSKGRVRTAVQTWFQSRAAMELPAVCATKVTLATTALLVLIIHTKQILDVDSVHNALHIQSPLHKVNWKVIACALQQKDGRLVTMMVLLNVSAGYRKRSKFSRFKPRWTNLMCWNSEPSLKQRSLMHSP